MTTEKIVFLEILATTPDKEVVKINTGNYKYLIPENIPEEELAKCDKIILKCLDSDAGSSEQLILKYDELFRPQEEGKIIQVKEKYSPFVLGFEHYANTEDGRPLFLGDTVVLTIDESELPDEYKGKVKVTINGNVPFIVCDEYTINIKVLESKESETEVTELQIIPIQLEQSQPLPEKEEVV